MINFKELPDDGVAFEQLIRELLIREEFEVRWTGVGPDGGRDLIFTERTLGPMAGFERTWLVSCKHNAHSEKSVGINDLASHLLIPAEVSAQPPSCWLVRLNLPLRSLPECVR
jgi:hypothetical protein